MANPAAAGVNELRAELNAIGQGHVFRFFDALDVAGRQTLIGQLAGLELGSLPALVDGYVRNKPRIDLPTDIRPVAVLPRRPDASRAQQYADAAERGDALLRDGKVGAFLVAGGQGTRLGYDGPKGEFPVTPVKRKPLFQVFAEQLRFHARRSGKPIPWYIMTSDANDARTRAFFEYNHFFGYPRGDVFFFQQGMMPAFNSDGTLLLEAKHSLALAADGHGGSLRALGKSGALADMNRRGIEHLSYFQVDNPIVQIIDPLFIGLHDLSGSEMSSKTIPKAGPLEKVGNFCIGDGVLQVIEYSDLPESLATQTSADGSLKFNAGSIAIHALRVAFIERLNGGGELKLPWHRAEKKVPYVDADGTLVKPEKANAVKLEQFVFDAIPLARNAIVYATERAEEFSPVKNADGTDSPATCERDQVRRNARWLKAAGVAVPDDAVIEISPLYAPSETELLAKKPQLTIRAGASVYIDENGKASSAA